jgi:hypothetical protein
MAGLVCMSSQSSAEAAVNQPFSVVADTLNQAVRYTYTKKSKFPGWISSTLKYYINKMGHCFSRYKRTKSDTQYAAFSYFCKHVENTIKSDTQHLLKLVDNKLKT